MDKRCYSVAELQDILGVSRQCIYELLKKKEFSWVMVGGKYRISKKSFDEWLDQNQYKELLGLHYRQEMYILTLFLQMSYFSNKGCGAIVLQSIDKGRGVSRTGERD